MTICKYLDTSMSHLAQDGIDALDAAVEKVNCQNLR